MKLTYRPEIDGLRAIAVGAVILYHAQITIFGHQPFEGGFIGVDIFFVISGYLITSIILKELVTTGSFSFKHFYERRARRILPALLFVMLVSLPFAWMYLLPSSFVDFSKSILYSLGFSSNFYFHYSGQEYGAESGLLKPFLHTWSLSVEEQFYILFPIVLLITFKYFSKYLVHILFLGFLISLVSAEWTSRSYASASFYFLHTRMWELLAGSILAYFEIILGHRGKNKILNLILPTLGLLLIGHSILFFNDKMFHPSFYTLSPIIGVCLIIWFSSKNELITKILSTKLFVGIGLISYSLYLWHYPIFAFARVNYTLSNNFEKFLFIIISILISVFSYKFIEKVFRKKTKLNLAILFLFLFLMTNIFINCLILYNSGYVSRLPKILIQVIKEKNQIKDTEGFCELSFRQIKRKGFCEFGKKNGSTINLAGDSILSSLSSDLIKRLEENYKINFLNIAGCWPIKNSYFVHKNKRRDPACNVRNQNLRLKKINSQKNSIVIIAGRLPLYLSSKTPYNDTYFGDYEIKGNLSKKDAIINNIYQLLENNHKIILLYPLPELPYDPIKKILSISKGAKIDNFKKEWSDKKFEKIPFEYFKKRSKSSFNLLDSIVHKNIYRIYPHKLICKDESCLIIINDNLMYEDSVHPSEQFSILINDLIIGEIKKIEDELN